MNKKCGKCEKTVYPTEELKCLDKVWHKGCFRCWDCGMSLTMKNYKGYDKKPYCNAHYPTTKFTSVADTPEMNRLAQNTKNQSLLKYHESFEASKGKCMSVADDPETKRHMENTAKISAVEYHKEFEKNQKGHKIQVADDPETQRIRANSAVISNVEYTKGYKHQKPQMAPPPGYGQSYGQKVPMGGYGTDQQAETFSPYSDKNQGHSVRYESNGAKEEALLRQQPGSIHDFDPANDKWGSIGQGYRPNSGGGRQDWEETVPVPTQPQYNPQPSQPPPQVHPGPAIPINQPLALHVRHPDEEPGRQRGYQEDPRQMAYQEPPRQRAYQEPPQQPPYQEPPRSQPAYHEPPPPQQPQPAPPAPKSSAVADAIYQAMYDYEAQDDDEVGFQDGDLIDNIEPIDDGWMFGTVRRTGMRGMLPANYVERVQ